MRTEPRASHTLNSFCSLVESHYQSNPCFHFLFCMSRLISKPLASTPKNRGYGVDRHAGCSAPADAHLSGGQQPFSSSQMAICPAPFSTSWLLSIPKQLNLTCRLATNPGTSLYAVPASQFKPTMSKANDKFELVAQICSLNTQEAEAGALLSYRPVWATN